MTPETKKQLLNEIDTLASQACRKMSTKEREEFFKFQEDRIDQGLSLSKKYNVPVRRYYKGKNKGKVKQVFEVNGTIFESLWAKLSNYATKASMSSHFTNDYQDDDAQNDIFDIRYQCFYVLRFFGPSPKGIKFSKFFPLIVNNILTTSARRRKEWLRTMINYSSVSLFSPISSGDALEEGESLLIDTLSDDTCPKEEDINLIIDIPEICKSISKSKEFNSKKTTILQKGIKSIVEGDASLTSVAKKLNLQPKVLRKDLEAFLPALQ